MALQKDAAVELRNRLNNLYEATLAVIATYLEREGRRINKVYHEIDLCEVGLSVSGSVRNEFDGYETAEVQIVRINDTGVYFFVHFDGANVGTVVYDRDEAKESFPLDLLVEIAENLERIVTDNE